MTSKVLGFEEKELEEGIKNYWWFTSGKKPAKINIEKHFGDITQVTLVPVVLESEHKAKVKALKEIISGLMQGKSPAKTFRKAVEKEASK